MRISIDLHDHRLTDYERHVLHNAMARILGRPDLDAALSASPGPRAFPAGPATLSSMAASI